MVCRGTVFSTGDTAGTGQVESLRQDPSQETIRLTELMLNNLAEDAGQYVASLPELGVDTLSAPS